MPSNNQQQSKKGKEVSKAVDKRREEVCKGAPTSTIIRSNRGDMQYILSEKCSRRSSNNIENQNHQRTATEKQKIKHELHKMLQSHPTFNIDKLNFGSVASKIANDDVVPAEDQHFINMLTCIIDGLGFFTQKNIKHAYPNIENRWTNFIGTWVSVNNITFTDDILHQIKLIVLSLLSRH